MSHIDIIALAIFLLIGTLGILMTIAEVFKPLTSLTLLTKSTGYNFQQHITAHENKKGFSKLTSFQASVLLGSNAMTIFLAVLAFKQSNELAWWALWYWPVMFIWHLIIYKKNTAMWYVQIAWIFLSVSSLLLTNKTISYMNTQETNKQVVQLFYEEGWNKKNFDIVYLTHADNWVHHDKSNPADLEGGPAGNIKRMRELSMAFPDIHFQIDDIIAENDKVVVRFTATGTQQGQFGKIPPTGKKISILGYITHRLENGKIVEDWVVRDTFGLLVQLGVIPVGEKNSE